MPSDAPSRLQCADLGRPLGEARSGMASTRSAPHPGHLKVTIRLDSWQRGSHPATPEPATSWKWAALEIKTHLPKLSPRTNELSAEREREVGDRAPIGYERALWLWSIAQQDNRSAYLSCRPRVAPFVLGAVC